MRFLTVFSRLNWAMCESNLRFPRLTQFLHCFCFFFWTPKLFIELHPFVMGVLLGDAWLLCAFLMGCNSLYGSLFRGKLGRFRTRSVDRIVCAPSVRSHCNRTYRRSFVLETGSPLCSYAPSCLSSSRRRRLRRFPLGRIDGSPWKPPAEIEASHLSSPPEHPAANKTGSLTQT